MGIEIERKFLVNSELFMHSGPPTNLILRMELQQGYLSKDPWVRVRIADTGQAWLTIKGRKDPVGIENPEWEYRIPIKEARELYDQLCRGKLEKIRREVDYEGRTWDVDEFLGPLEGLWLAEIELNSPDDPFQKPPWLGTEVTGLHYYSNGWMAENGMPPLVV